MARKKPTTANNNDDDDNNNNVKQQTINVEQYSEIIKDIESGDSKFVLNAVTEINKILSESDAQTAPIQEFFECGLVHKLVLLLSNDSLKEESTLLEDCSFALSNIAAYSNNKHTSQLLDLGVVPILLSLISTSPPSSSSSQVIVNSIATLGNIAGEGKKYRDTLLKSSILDTLSKTIKNSLDNQEILKSSSDALKNLCSGKPSIPKKYVEKVKEIVKLLLSSECKDEDLLGNAFWAISNVLEDVQVNEEGDPIVSSDILEVGVQTMKDNVQNKKILIPALRFVGNCLTGDEETTQIVLEQGVIDVLGNLLRTESSNRQICKEVCWSFSNITAGSERQIQKVINSGYLADIINISKNKRFASTVTPDCVWILSNAITGGNNEQIECLVNDYDIIEVLTQLLSNENPDRDIFIALKKISQLGSDYKSGPNIQNRFYDRFKNFLDKVGDFQFGPNISDELTTILLSLGEEVVE
eukprot:gene8443-10370_t